MIAGLKKEYKKRIDALMMQYPYQFYMYGSRARGTEKPLSDLDLCIFSDVSLITLAELKEAFNNLMLPFTVDLVAWGRLSEDFRNMIKNDMRAYIPDPFLGATIIDLSSECSYGKGKNLSSIDVATLYAPCSFFIQSSDAVSLVTDVMIKQHEEQYGPLAERSWLVIMMGDKKNDGKHAFYLSDDAIDYLVGKRILGICSDMVCHDTHNDQHSTYTKLLAMGGLIIIEGLRYYPTIKGNGYWLQVVPVLIGDGVTVRVLLIQQD
jgi:uncharacterized protein